eukprot:CAMPEP_0113898944 /NCGR_PEP_ID=MMETSP0780_2-20120614/19712_1 /TAXON_ID=652834 /ORGANISM="Palpitomonas bilix" /LENGTH=227 /DNA_ID=CAMNT_0000890967 /DNA_START=821 /DNA_END=1505 /DNA_ORIENTATION=+ /assembly_acc=CAM_ASM_000599
MSTIYPERSAKKQNGVAGDEHSSVGEIGRRTSSNVVVPPPLLERQVPLERYESTLVRLNSVMANGLPRPSFVILCIALAFFTLGLSLIPLVLKTSKVVSSLARVLEEENEYYDKYGLRWQVVAGRVGGGALAKWFELRLLETSSLATPKGKVMSESEKPAAQRYSESGGARRKRSTSLAGDLLTTSYKDPAPPPPVHHNDGSNTDKRKVLRRTTSRSDPSLPSPVDP